MKYITIPREIIYAKDLDDNRVLVYAFLYAKRSFDGTLGFSTEYMVTWMGFKPDNHKGRINEKIFSIINSIAAMGYMTNDYVLPGKAFSYSVLNMEKIHSNDHGIITFEELDKIINFKRELKNKDLSACRISPAKLLLLLSYIRVNINHGTNSPQCCYRQYKNITKDIGVNEQYISKLVSILEEFQMIKHKEPKRKAFTGDNGQDIVVTAPKVFADCFRYVKGENGELIIDSNYDPEIEIEKQIKILQRLPIKKEN